MLSPTDPQFSGSSGRIINVTTTLPTQIYKNDETNGEWAIRPISGNSALYASHRFLESSSWETHIVGWTGELHYSTAIIPQHHGNASNTTHSNNNELEECVHASADRTETDPLYLSEAEKTAIERKLQPGEKTTVHPVWLLRKDQLRWRHYAEEFLWPVFHYIQPDPATMDGKFETEAWRDYVRFNEAYMQAIADVYQPGDIIWIHDYYLLLLPQLVRMRFPDARVGLYVHAPFPSSEYFRCLSRRKQLLDGMLGANQVGFQCASFVRHFISCCTRLLGCEATPSAVSAYGLDVAVFTLPIGVDVDYIQREAFLPAVDERLQAIRELYPGKKLIVGRDRLDAVRGVVQKLEAFEMFLSMYPEWRETVVLIQVSSPTYATSAKLERKVNELIASINGEYGLLEHTPVQHYQMRVMKEEYFALLRAADLSIVSSIRDGMSTTSLEFVVCQQGNSSPLILSEFTGTASVLKDAFLVNPWDAVGVSRSINECLLMSDEKKLARQTKLLAEVQANTVQLWTNAFVSRLMTSETVPLVTPALNRPLVLAEYRAANRRLFLFDYDGTLTPIVQDPAAATPSHKLDIYLDLLAEDPKNQVWIISGRDQAFLEKWMGGKNVGLSAEHGCFMKDLGSHEWVNLAAEIDMLWQKKVEAVFQKYTDRTPGTNIEMKKVAVTWHHRRADPDFGNYQAGECYRELMATIAITYDVEVMIGKANIEVRPKVLNKGEIVKRLVRANHGAKQGSAASMPEGDVADFVFCAGDDLTDEDMFRALSEVEIDRVQKGYTRNQWNGFGVHPVAVGPASKKTTATAHLVDPAAVIETIGLFTGHVSIFEAAGTVELDDRGHIAGSESSVRALSRTIASTKI
ncbi:glycosyltransferase family 20 protein [Babjeviella inositovora NRRL Y-12698]|uniref:Glycosyltransferase family 20 protein n=1 Tax=Babjeviella inositovora NRRL Y-12698 TaxID=984486 RepID=A0A1E3QHQ8_9ASCO|nr:glycosyltransferase family 20 protein [Babjeviella inositovora NRRL Y-12698]ODQ77235.1 glycosyltransferase family 20 protein [Babjeviella inositovora NRRL Y-12698]